jgi:hypothetical protein
MKCAVVVFIFSLLTQPLFADYEVFYENGKAGIRDESGNVLIPATYDALGWSDGSFSVLNNVTGYRRDTRWGLVNLKKEQITKPEYENLTSGGGDRVVASRWINAYTKKFGCLDLEGKITVPFQYDVLQILGLRAIACIKNGPRYEYGLIDLNNKTILKLAYRDIKSIGSLRFAVQNFDRKTALYTEEGTSMTGFVIDSISPFRKGYALVYEDLKVGLLDRFGEMVLPPSYRQLNISDDATVTGKSFPVWREIDSGNKLVRELYADDFTPGTRYNRISIAGKLGTVDANFKVIVNPRYEYLGAFTNNQAIACRDGKFGVIRSDGSIVIPFEHDSLYLQNDLLRSLQIKNAQRQWSVYDTFGIKKTARTYEKITAGNGRFFHAQRNGHWGAVDRYGNEFIGCVYDGIKNSSFDHIAVTFKGLHGIIDYQEKWIVPAQPNPVWLVNDHFYFEKNDSILFVKDFAGQIIYFTTNQLTVTERGYREVTPEGNIKLISWQGISSYEAAPPLIDDTERVFIESEGYRGVLRDGRYGFIDQRGRLRIANRYEAIGRFSEGVAPVMIRGKWGFVSTEDQVVINPNYERVTEFQNGISIVNRNGRTGVLSRDGKVALPIRYDSIKLSSGKLLIYSNGNIGLADVSGHVLIEPRFKELGIAADNIVVVSDGTLWGALSYDGMPVIPVKYSALRYDPKTGHFFAKEEKGWEKLLAKKD